MSPKKVLQSFWFTPIPLGTANTNFFLLQQLGFFCQCSFSGQFCAVYFVLLQLKKQVAVRFQNKANFGEGYWKQYTGISFYQMELAIQHLGSLLLGACKDAQLTLRWLGHEYYMKFKFWWWEISCCTFPWNALNIQVEHLIFEKTVSLYHSTEIKEQYFFLFNCTN